MSRSPRRARGTLRPTSATASTSPHCAARSSIARPTRRARRPTDGSRSRPSRGARPAPPRVCAAIACTSPAAAGCASTRPAPGSSRRGSSTSTCARSATVRLPGLPSRARVSPDGRYGSVTAFVSGHSYAQGHVLDPDDHHRPGPPEGSRRRRDLQDAQRRQAHGLVGPQRLGRHVRRHPAGASTRPRRPTARRISSRATSPAARPTRCARTSSARRCRPTARASPTRRSWARRPAPGSCTCSTSRRCATRRCRSRARSTTRSNGSTTRRVLYAVDGDVWVADADGGGRPRRFIAHAESPVVVRSTSGAAVVDVRDAAPAGSYGALGSTIARSAK